jgi:hypothetical protein
MCHRVFAKVDTLFFLELVCEVINQYRIEVIAA